MPFDAKAVKLVFARFHDEVFAQLLQALVFGFDFVQLHIREAYAPSYKYKEEVCFFE